MKINKRGFLLGEETLKILIAVIVLTFLFYFLVSLYFSTQNSKEIEQAEESLNFLISEAEAGRMNIEIYNPKNWWILNFEDKICICKNDNIQNCVNKGICLNNNGFTLIENIKIENPPIILNINQQSRIISK